MAGRLFDIPLNGLAVKRQGPDGSDVEGTVVSSNIRGRPTQDTPFVASEYTVEWVDGRIESSLSREAILKMKLDRWSSPLWADAFFEADGAPEAGPLHVLGAPTNSKFFTPLTAAKPAPVAKPRSAGPVPSPASEKAGIMATMAAGLSSIGRQQYAAQDKSKIGSLIPGHPDAVKEQDRRAAALSALGSPGGTSRPKEAAPKATPKTAAAAKQSAGKAGGTAGKKKRKKKDDSDDEQSESEPEEEVEEEEEGEEELPEFMRREYPRDVCFRPGDTPLSVYKNQPEDPDAEFEILAIVDEVVYDRKKYVLVKWDGYELDTTDWSPIADVKHTDIYKEWAKNRKAEEQLKKKAKTSD